MKRQMAISLALILIGASMTIASARPPHHGCWAAGTGPHYGCRMHHNAPPRFLDANADGICDHRAPGPFASNPWRDMDGDGVPNGRDADYKRKFVDANGDGVCDYRQPAEAPEKKE